MNCLFNYAFLLALLPLMANAQASRLFQWAMQPMTLQLPTCQELKIVVSPFNGAGNSTGVPPYYMQAYAPGGAVESQLIGSDPANLKWTPRFPANTQLLLSVIDANSTSGGVPPSLFTTVTGQNTNCIPQTLSSPPNDFTVTANVTDKLETCGLFGLSIRGGVKPYNVTILALNSPVTTNVTMGPVDDAFVYANRADPNVERKLLAAVSDFTGRWAFGTPIVETFGSSDADCPGINSASTSIQVVEADAQNRHASEQKRTTALIAGIVVPVVLLLIAGGVGFWFWRRRRAAQGSEGSGVRSLFNKTGPKRLASTDNFQPGAMENGQMEATNGGQVLSIASYLENGTAPPTRSHTVTTSQSTRMTTSPTTTSPTYSVPETVYTARSSSLHSSGARPGFSSFPRSSVRNGRGSAKAMEAGFPLEEEHGMAFANPDSPASASGSGRPLPLPGHPDAIYQHTDSSMAARELPPPYMAPGGP